MNGSYVSRELACPERIYESSTAGTPTYFTFFPRPTWMENFSPRVRAFGFDFWTTDMVARAKL